MITITVIKATGIYQLSMFQALNLIPSSYYVWINIHTSLIFPFSDEDVKSQSR